MFTLCSLCSSFDAQVVRHRNCPGNASSTRKGEDCEDREDAGGTTSQDVALLSCFQRFHMVPCCVSRAHCQVDFTAPLRAALLVRRATLSSDEVLRDPDRYPWVLCPSAQRVPRVFGFHVPNGIATETDLNLSAWSLLPHLSGCRQIYAELWSWIRLARVPRSGKWQQERLERHRKKPMWLHNLYNHS